MIKFLNWLLRWMGIELVALPYLSPEIKTSAKELIAQMDNAVGSGEFKRAQVLRALLNRHPELRERDCALAIELALRGL